MEENYDKKRKIKFTLPRNVYLLIFYIITLAWVICLPDATATHNKVYHNEIAAYISSGQDGADRVAVKHGLVNKGQIGNLHNYFLFAIPRRKKRDLTQDHHTFKRLEEDGEIQWFEQQTELIRKKRIDPFQTQNSMAHRRMKRQIIFNIDPLFNIQWHLNRGANEGYDMNVQAVWERGITGKGAVVSILDDGIQVDHPDLIQNYDPEASFDINDNDPFPIPQDNGDNKHGTRCAGEVAATAFNGICGVGIAYNASIGGVRMLDGIVNDAVEARALSLNPNHIDIYSASWGPEDDGMTVDGPGPLAKRAFLNGVLNGRRGKGSIFVWASGNGGANYDNCNCDGYTNSIFTLSISSATQKGLKPWYLEECSSTLATTFSSGTPGQDSNIVTVDQDSELASQDRMCTVSHTGTSASAPIAAGIVALALEANPNLTWRDVQYIVVESSSFEPLKHEDGWIVNGAGKAFSHKFGFGLMNANETVNLASRWPGLPRQRICQTIVMKPKVQIGGGGQHSGAATDTARSQGCHNSVNSVKFLEHVQCKVSLNYKPRGKLMITLISPSGTRSNLLYPRPNDRLTTSLENWPFLSVHFWGEDPTGTWSIEVIDADLTPGRRGRGSQKQDDHSSDNMLHKWQLIFYGTESNPFRVPRSTFSFPNNSKPPRSTNSQQQSPSFFQTMLGGGQKQAIRIAQPFISKIRSSPMSNSNNVIGNLMRLLSPLSSSRTSSSGQISKRDLRKQQQNTAKIDEKERVLATGDPKSHDETTASESEESEENDSTESSNDDHHWDSTILTLEDVYLDKNNDI